MTAPAALLFASILFVVYVLFGYPFLLGWLSRRFARPVARGPFRPTVSIVVATHNGEEFIESKLASIAALEYPRGLMEILIVSDGSTDRSDAIARAFAEASGAAYGFIRVLSLPRGGKPSALNAAIAQATGEILVLTDVRQPLAPDSLRLLLENFADPAVGAASGELVILDGKTGEEAAVGLYWKYEFRIRLRLSAIDSIFGATGAFYAIRRSLAVRIPPDSLLDDVYLPLAAFFRGYRLVVDPRARAFDRPTGLESEFRRKVRTLAGNYQIVAAYPALLGFGNRLWFHYVSYKFARLFLPFALLAIMAASLFTPEQWRVPLVAAQVLFYATALADHWIPDAFPLKKATAAARTFVTLMAATACAISIFFVPSDKLWHTPPAGGKP
jgi:cellulose synthase/poly-beta-1,6-N-acetylglucosamine synthase-like glycosyltransferase